MAETWVCVTSRGESSGSSALCFRRCPFSRRFNGKCSSDNSGRESNSLAIDLCYSQSPTFRFAMFADHSGEKKEEGGGFAMLRVANQKRHITTQHTVNILLRRGCFVVVSSGPKLNVFVYIVHGGEQHLRSLWAASCPPWTRANNATLTCMFASHQSGWDGNRHVAGISRVRVSSRVHTMLQRFHIRTIPLYCEDEELEMCLVFWHF